TFTDINTHFVNVLAISGFSSTRSEYINFWIHNPAIGSFSQQQQSNTQAAAMGFINGDGINHCQSNAGDGICNVYVSQYNAETRTVSGTFAFTAYGASGRKMIVKN